MLFKNVLFAALLAGKTLSSPLSVTIDIDVNGKRVSPARAVEDPDYEVITGMLGLQADVFYILATNVTEVSETKANGLVNLADGMNIYRKIAIEQAKSVGKSPLTEGETAMLESPFVTAVTELNALSKAIEDNADPIKKYDDGKFYRAFQNDRNAWSQFYTALRARLFRCEEIDGPDCVGSRVFNRNYQESMDASLKALRSIRQKKDSILLQKQFDL